MITKTRTTAQGTEYWDSKEKRTRFVPKGKKPNFEVTENPKSMIVGVDLATGKDETVINGQVVEDEINLDDLNKEQLLAFAEDHEIKIPGNVSKEEKIREIIEASLTADDE